MRWMPCIWESRSDKNMTGVLRLIFSSSYGVWQKSSQVEPMWCSISLSPVLYPRNYRYFFLIPSITHDKKEKCLYSEFCNVSGTKYWSTRLCGCPYSQDMKRNPCNLTGWIFSEVKKKKRKQAFSIRNITAYCLMAGKISKSYEILNTLFSTGIALTDQFFLFCYLLS